MSRKNRSPDRVDLELAKDRVESNWAAVVERVERDESTVFVTDDDLRAAIAEGIHHAQVAYRYCLPVQLLGKLVNPTIDALCLQRGDDAESPLSWDARSLASKVIAPFIIRQENVLGTSLDPYVGNAMRVPRMLRDDRSKKDVAGWNRLIDVLDAVERADDPEFTEQAFRQVLLEIYRRQQSQRFTYPLPLQVSLDTVLAIADRFLGEKSGGDRALALVGALFDVIGERFGLYVKVNRARINASDEASGQAADLECLDADGRVVVAVEVKDRTLTFADLEGTIIKARHRKIRDVIFAASGVLKADAGRIKERLSSSVSSGQNLYVSDFDELARVVLMLGGEAARILFLKQVGRHLDEWTTQPAHRKAWKRLLEEA